MLNLNGSDKKGTLGLSKQSVNTVFGLQIEGNMVNFFTVQLVTYFIVVLKQITKRISCFKMAYFLNVRFI
jgi:hypothetical protein